MLQSFFSESVTKYYNLLIDDKSWQASDDEEYRAEIHFVLEMLGIADKRGNVKEMYERLVGIMKAGK